MHGGAGPVLSGMSLQQLDLRYRTALVQALQDPAAAESPLLGEGGPNWYRGTALCNEVSETDVLQPLLQQFGVTHLVVGHTPTRDGRAVTRFGGQVVKLDAGMNHAFFKGRAVALFIDSSGWHVRYAGEAQAESLQPEGLFVAPMQVEDGAVLAALRMGTVTVSGPRGPDQLDVSVSYTGRRIPAVFRVLSADAAHREVAAWRLDRLLGLGIVPATVEQELQGKHGVLQARPLKWLTEADARQNGGAGSGWCSTGPQLQLLYSFDTLVGNEARRAASIIYDADEWLVYATSFTHAFGTSRGLPDYLRDQPPMPGAELRRRLAALDETGLSTVLGDLLDARQRGAILRRRDTLLALPAPAARATSP